MLELVNVRLGVGEKQLCENLSFKVGAGEMLALMGPSGCGKSTLLSLITGVIDDGFRKEGEVRLGGKRLNEVPPEKRKIGVLLQDPLLFPHMSVLENIAFGVPARHRRKEKFELARKLLESVELPEYAKRDPMKLSGGQQARVALARTLASEPRMLLLDEPFSKLDEAMRFRLGDFVKNLIRQKSLPTVMVVHDQSDANRWADRVFPFPLQSPTLDT